MSECFVDTGSRDIAESMYQGSSDTYDIGTVGSWRGVDALSPRIRSRTQSESTVCLPRHQHLTAQVPADMDEHQETRTNHLSKD